MNLEDLKKKAERVDDLEERLDRTVEQFKKVVRNLNDRVEELEDSPNVVGLPRAEDEYVNKNHRSGLVEIHEPMVMYCDHDRGYVTIALQDGRGCAVTRDKWEDPRVDFDDLHLGYDDHEKLFVPKSIDIDEPIEMRAVVGEQHDTKLRIKWKNKWGDVYWNGIVNYVLVMQKIANKVGENPPRNQYGAIEVDEVMTIRVLPWYVERGGWELDE